MVTDAILVYGHEGWQNYPKQIAQTDATTGASAVRAWMCAL